MTANGRSSGLWQLVARFSVSGLCALTVALWLRGPFLWFLWPAVSWLGLAYAYLQNQPKILGKRSDGTLHWLSVAIFLPHLAMGEIFFHFKRLVLKLEPCWNEIAPGLYIGRRPLPRELPKDARWVVDLTAELFESREVVRHGHYRCLPTLNRWVPEDADFRRLTRELADVSEPIYVHCGSGLGRAATVMSVVLILRGLEQDVDRAEERLRRVRSRVYLHPSQRALVTRTTSSA